MQDKEHPTNQVPNIPDYEVLKDIGSGSYGEVWLVRSVTGQHYAAKVVRRERFANDKPFEREFNGILKFEPVSRTHPSQVDILHVGRDEGFFYYIMELADDVFNGRDIDPEHYAAHTLSGDLLEKGRLPAEDCIHYGMALTTALQHLHLNGLVHRDVKPSNIIFVDGNPSWPTSVWCPAPMPR